MSLVACEAIGRDVGSLVISAAATVAAGTTSAEATRRASAIGREVAELAADGLVGTAAEIVDRLGELGDAGVTRVYLQVLDLQDLDHLDFIAREVVPQLG